jgi:hypothetical protein
MFWRALQRGQATGVIPAGVGGLADPTRAAMMTPMAPKKKPRAKNPPGLRPFFLAIAEAHDPKPTAMRTKTTSPRTVRIQAGTLLPP